ncbi:MAG: sulfurtransferase-like selenium metabolism protein YedF [Clostridiaceae bacterium]
MVQIDAKGKACPQPVILAKKELDGGCRDLTVLVDNRAAVENLTRLGGSMGVSVSSGDAEGGYFVRFTGEAVPGSTPVIACAPSGNGYAVFIGKDYVGAGDYTLGYNLMKMAIYTLSQSDDVPAYLLFMNDGVKLPAGEEPQVIENLHALIEKGTRILVCGTCLNYYHIAEQLKVGIMSNMYDILTAMQRADKVITL